MKVTLISKDMHGYVVVAKDIDEHTALQFILGGILDYVIRDGEFPEQLLREIHGVLSPMNGLHLDQEVQALRKLVQLEEDEPRLDILFPEGWHGTGPETKESEDEEPEG